MALSGFSEGRAKWFDRFEWAVAVLLTGAAVALQTVNFRHAGGLWRDEAAAVNLAQMPSWSAIWANLEHESFPLLITVVIRAWSAVGFGDTDAGLRLLGLLISLGVVAALWSAAWQFTKRPPVLMLLLVALSPVIIRWGGSLRAYGLGVLLIVLAIAAMWRLLERGAGWKSFAFATACSVLAVHALYQNALVVLAMCLAAAGLAVARRDWKLTAAIACVGAATALSLTPYLGVIRRASEWNVATQVAIDFGRIWTVFHRALAASGSWMPWVWATLAAVALVLAAIDIWNRNLNDRRYAAALPVFLISTCIITGVAYLVFLKVTKFPTEEWYYLLWIAVFALGVDVVIAHAARAGRARPLRPLVALIAVAFLFPVVLQAVKVRATNVDYVAARLNALVATGDVVLVHPWFCVVSLARYYDGKGELVTLPPVADQRLQRLDLFKAQIANEGAIDPVLAKLETTLRGGGSVWLIGHFQFSNPPQPAPSLPRAGEGPEGWRGAPYMAAYGMQVAYFLQMHALQSTRIDVPVDQPVHSFEDLPVRSVSGWRTSRAAR